MEAAALRPLLPHGLQPEERDGSAWLTATPFRVSGMRPSLLPPLPVVSAALELNLRTYVRHGDRTGVWFFTLESTNPLAVAAARSAFHLPFHFASGRYEVTRSERRFEVRRRHPGAPDAAFAARWTVGWPLPAVAPGSLEAFLVERYSLFAASSERLWSARIAHARFTLREVQVEDVETTLFRAHGLPDPGAPALAHAPRRPLDVATWPLRRVR